MSDQPIPEFPRGDFDPLVGYEDFPYPGPVTPKSTTRLPRMVAPCGWEHAAPHIDALIRAYQAHLAHCPHDHDEDTK